MADEGMRGETRLAFVSIAMLAVLGTLIGGGVGLWVAHEKGVPYGFAVFLAAVGGVGLPSIGIPVVESMRIKGE